MSLNKNDAIRIDREPDSNGHMRDVYIFLCQGKDCDKTCKISFSHLKLRTGPFCMKCAKRKRHRYQTVYNGMKDSVIRTNKRFKRDITFELSFEDFLEFTEINCCRYCNKGVVWTEYAPGPYNLDRKDSSKGYIKDNLTVCCYACNHKKNRFYTDTEFAAINDFLRTWHRVSEQERQELMYAILTWDDEGMRLEAI